MKKYRIEFYTSNLKLGGLESVLSMEVKAVNSLEVNILASKLCTLLGYEYSSVIIEDN